RYEGVQKVYLIYRRTKEQMPADKEEFYAALNDRVEFKELLLPVKFQDGVLTCQKMALGQMGSDGRKEVVPVENEFVELQVDSVIAAIGEHVDKEYLHRNKIRMAHNKAVVNETNETEVKNVFIGGDALRGPSTVVESIADGKKVAETIIKRESQDNQHEIALNYFVDDPKLFEDIKRRKGEIVNQSASDFFLEANRCLGCNFICNKCVEVCPNRANVAIESPDGMFKDKYQILHLDALCNECGNCETFCPYQSKPYKEKPTLFSNEEDFGNSRNNGFFISQSKNQTTVFIRWKYERGSITFDDNGDVIKSSYFEQKEISTLFQWIKIICKDYSFLLPN
ncbi:MAG: FAD-dependent oxidoreductase, partial [Bacteroidetes bacterium]|nr:FAD-dependent oxidoreductase [Bacteroidota bacterium]